MNNDAERQRGALRAPPTWRQPLALPTAESDNEVMLLVLAVALPASTVDVFVRFRTRTL